MRAIKFRAWDSEKKEMLKISRFTLGHSGEVCSVDAKTDEPIFEKRHFNRLERIVLMQCIGFRDKNGLLIYEGDWIRQTLKNVHLDFPRKTEDIIQEGIVIWRNRAPCFIIDVRKRSWEGKMASQGYPSEFVNEYEQEYEVIGNIYESPELLK